MNILSVGIAAGSGGFFFLAAYIFFSTWLFKDYEVQDSIIQILFATIFMLSMSLYEIVIFEVANLLIPSEERQRIMQIDLFCLAVLLIWVLPFYLFFTVAREYGSRRRYATIFAVAMQATFLMAFRQLGVIVEGFSGKTHGLLSLESCIAGICAFGVSCMAILSGFGAVNCPYQYLSIFWRKIADEDIQFLEKRLWNTLQMVLNKKKRLAVEKSEYRRRSTDTGGQSFWSTTMGLFNKGVNKWKDTSGALSSLQAEIKVLENFSQELFLEIHEMKLLQKRSQFSKTLRGRFFNFLGYILSAYCVYKMFMGSINVIFNRSRVDDPITAAIKRIMYIWPEVSAWINLGFITEFASLLLVGILVFTQTRGFLINLLKIFRAWSTVMSSNSIVLWLAHLMGMYFVSSFVLMRGNLQKEHRRRIDAVLGDIEFNMYHKWFDILFVLSALGSIATLFLLQKSKGSRASVDYQIHDKFP